ncbi:MAG: PQQ-binding-like beta-propeller repeat protein [Chloroflexi bacterium]|nr:PQQ-binding-like beta-propeller repeat protein [Chloroflexota bacterium]
MKYLLTMLGLIVLTALACGQAPTPTPITPSLVPTANSANLWFLTRGEAKSDQDWGVDADSQGNIYTAGYYQSPASATFFDMVMYKFAPDGKEMWRTQWGGKLQEKAFVVAVAEPYVYVGGLQNNSLSLFDSDMIVLALDTNDGHVIWNFKWGQGFGYQEVDGLVVNGDHLFVSGWTTGEKTEGDIGLLKLNRADGSLVWAKTWGTAKFDSADGQMVVDNDAVYISGRTNGANMLTGGEAVIVKFSKETGEYLDHRTWGGPLFSDGLGMTSDGTFLYVTGLTLDKGNGGQIFLLKYDKNLNLIWEQTWGGKGAESARAAEVDANGNILIAGNTFSYGAGKGDIALLQFSPDGKLNWSQLWGGPLDDSTQDLVIDRNFVYLVGSTENKSQGMNDALLIKADSQTGQFPPP